ncbi:hypothetical protein NOS3756_24300 [Nostoc sp. NIES-3756]|jgi:hypothetical protein|uniref:DUF705 domain-containing protein n=1 Tax=Nostoc sp. NIES-3756 TaxID=1751286 RepID=UPI000722B3B0|nr:DUF705 domain-containing protein [Nostoc sp. NIES-3756]BAT53469.1 hypothetical protein NOS3756_24300 [Nostoc sp. NIES-3756]BAY38793.1 hypothetical protein NIES2111_31410 [Nostoc sp. NIES-2111]
MQQFIIYVDVDDTLIRTFSGKRIRIPSTINHIKELKQQNAVLYCWSSGGAEYAKMVAEELGISEIFAAFLPKPNMLLDDQNVNDWKYLIQVHPMSCNSMSLDKYRQQVFDNVSFAGYDDD